MIRKLEIRLINRDERGALFGLLNSAEIKEVNLVESEANTSRGNHYHKETVEYMYFIRGSGTLIWKEVGKDKTLEGETDYKEGELIEVEPMTLHTMKADSKTICIKFQTNDMDKVDDIHKPEGV